VFLYITENKCGHSLHYVISDCSTLKNVKNINNFFEKGAEFFLAGIKGKYKEGGGRILLGDKAGFRAVMLRLSGFTVLDCMFQP
jgi:hypothetical protein